MITLSPQWLAIADCVDKYESGRGDSFPDLRSFVSAMDEKWRRDALAELVVVDMEFRFKAGQPFRCEDYLERYPEIGPKDTLSVEIISAEYRIRTQNGEDARLAAFCHRFPTQAGDLRERVLTLPESQCVEMSSTETATNHADASKYSRELTATVAEPAYVEESVKQQFEVFGRYRIIRELGKGGMGKVLLAHDTVLGRLVALKFPAIEPDHAEIILERFQREARAAATLKHPNICTVYDVGEHEGQHYISMEFVQGSTLSSTIRDNQVESPAWIARVVQKTALALQEAHDHGIVHRDIKPGNIMIDKRGEPILMDFGLVHVTISDSQLTQSGAILGTPAYMSPEQSVGDEVGPPSDIYSLGCVLYELLARRLPFEGPPGKVLMKILSETPPKPSQLKPGVNAQLEGICLRAMAKHPRDRFATAAEFAAALAGIDPTDVAAEPSNSNEVQALELAPTVVLPPKRRTQLAVSGLIVVAGLLVAFFLIPRSPAAKPASLSEKATVASIPPDSEKQPAPGASQRPRETPVGENLAANPSTASGRPVFEIHLQRAAENSGYRALGPQDVPLRDKDKVQLHVVLPRAAYAYVYWYDGEGKPARLWPKDANDQQALREVWSPPLSDKDEQLWHVVGGTKGTELSFMAMSERPLTAHELHAFEQIHVVPSELSPKGDLQPLSRGLVGVVKSKRQATPSPASVDRLPLLLPTGSSGRLAALPTSSSLELSRGLTGSAVSNKGAQRTHADQFEALLRQRFQTYVGLVFPHE